MRTTILLMLIYAMALSACHADDGFFGGSGNTVFPSTATKVRMVSETVSLKKQDLTVYVDCDFTFLNSGEDAEITMGFPAETSEAGQEREWRADHPDEDMDKFEPVEVSEENAQIHDFTVLVDGVEVKNHVKKIENLENIHGLNFDHAFLWSVKLAHDKPVHLHHTYNFLCNGQLDDYTISYILKTGALWYGTIGQADISIDLGEAIPIYLLNISPGKYKYKNGVIHWLFTDLKPTEDIRVDIQKIENKLQMLDLVQYKSLKNHPAGFKKELRLLRNEIYACHGKTFESKDLQEYFSKQDWYSPDAHFSPQMLTSDEKKLIDKISKMESAN